MFILFAVQRGLINPILLLRVEFCFWSSVDKMVLDAQEGIGLKKYDEWQTESNRLQGERSAGRTKTERNKQEEHVSQWKTRTETEER